MSPCHFFKGKDGGFVIACTRGDQKRCKAPGCNARATILCDGKLRGALEGKTCDIPLCPKHAVKVGPDRHLCPAHAKAESEARG